MEWTLLYDSSNEVHVIRALSGDVAITAALDEIYPEGAVRSLTVAPVVKWFTAKRLLRPDTDIGEVGRNIPEFSKRVVFFAQMGQRYAMLRDEQSAMKAFSLAAIGASEQSDSELRSAALYRIVGYTRLAGLALGKERGALERKVLSPYFSEKIIQQHESEGDAVVASWSVKNWFDARLKTNSKPIERTASADEFVTIIRNSAYHSLQNRLADLEPAIRHGVIIDPAPAALVATERLASLPNEQVDGKQLLESVKCLMILSHLSDAATGEKLVQSSRRLAAKVMTEEVKVSCAIIEVLVRETSPTEENYADLRDELNEMQSYYRDALRRGTTEANEFGMRLSGAYARIGLYYLSDLISRGLDSKGKDYVSLQILHRELSQMPGDNTSAKMQIALDELFYQ